jgi:hypothetical protein
MPGYDFQFQIEADTRHAGARRWLIQQHVRRGVDFCPSCMNFLFYFFNADNIAES